MTWDPISRPIDYVILAGQRSPGIATIEGLGAPREWVERRGYGLSGASIRYRGNRLAHFKLILRLTTPEDWTNWHAWRPIVQRPPLGERARSMEIIHPLCEMWEIRSVVVENVLAPVQAPEGWWTITVEVIEYRQPIPALQTVEGTATTLPGNGSPEQQIAHLTQVADDLSGEAAVQARAPQ